MSDLDHMLNGRGSRQQLQHRIRQAQQDKLAREVESAQDKRKPFTSLFTILTSLSHIIWR